MCCIYFNFQFLVIPVYDENIIIITIMLFKIKNFDISNFHF